MTHGKPRKSYGLLPHGDLWVVFHDIVKARGASCLAVSWHKAHVTWAQALRGEYPPDEALHNSMADAAASKGAEANGHGPLVELLRYFYLKQQAYTSFVKSIHALILRVMESDHALREAKAADQRKAARVHLQLHAAKEDASLLPLTACGLIST